jgi:glycerol-3-phosphate acyltransferase PlsY
MLYWPGAVVGLVVCAILVAATRYVSLGSIVGTIVGLIAAVLAVMVGGQPAALALFGIATGVLVILQHRDNIQRLLAGTERRIGQRAEPVRPA